MKLFAISDIHVEHAANRQALEALAPQPADWLILAGDISATVHGLAWALDTLGPKFARLLWVPGNHDLWVERAGPDTQRGVARYERLVACCRTRGVLTPEDPFLAWPEQVEGRNVRIALLFALYDYSFAPDQHCGRERAIKWAAEAGIMAADEVLLLPDPYPSREAWCRARVSESERKLSRYAEDTLVLVNHWPLRRDLVRLGKVPRYSPWCGTRATEHWHQRFHAIVSVHGHLHVRATDQRDGVRFEEVSLGYPAHWDHSRGAAGYLRRIL
jgi:3',5'-cyclic AMP phosphodiesterase CpdA